MAYIASDSRYQATLFPATVEEYVSTDAPVRIIDAFVDSLDFVALGFERARSANTGSQAMTPGIC